MTTFLPSMLHRWLPPLPGLERDKNHRYRLGSHTFAVSVTGVLATSKGAYARKVIEDTRDQWETRGNTVHRSMELAATVPDWHPDHWPTCWPFIDWVWPLLTHPLWREAVMVASEMGVYSLALDVAGQFDGAFEVNGRRLLFDLKTQGSAKASSYDTRPQLGGYITLAREHGIAFDGAATLWSRPGRTQVRLYDASECLEAWEGALAAFRAVRGRVARAEAAGVQCDPRFDPFAL